MSIEFELEDDGQIRVHVDRKGERAVSDVMDPTELIRAVADEADLDLRDLVDEGEQEIDPVTAPNLHPEDTQEMDAVDLPGEEQEVLPEDQDGQDVPAPTPHPEPLPEEMGDDQSA